MNTIQLPTDEQVESYFRAKLAEIHESNDYGHVNIHICAFKQSPNQPLECFAYVGNHTECQEGGSLTEAIAKLHSATVGKTKSQLCREKAADLLAEAESLDAVTA